jgi:arylsulfatase A-like enzyme
MSPKRPHIIIFNPDQWRGEALGHMGNRAVPTPTLDRLIETDAVSFSNAYCQNPVCTPSRCSFMSGWYPHVRGHRTMFHMMQPDEPVLLRDLKEAGYYVWWGGKNDLVPGQYGYEDYCNVRHKPSARPGRPIRMDLHGSTDWRGEPGSDRYYSFYYGRVEKPEGFPPEEDFVYDGDWDVVFNAIEMIKNRPEDQPLCLFLALGKPHPPYAIEDPWYSSIDRSAMPPRIPAPEDWSGKPSILKGLHERQNMQTWSEEQWAELRATYYGMCSRTDHELGLIIEALRSEGIYDDTAIFLFSDHGDFTGDYGLVEKTQNTFEDCLTRVPFVIKPPADAAVQPGLRDALVELVDFRATVEALTGLQPGYTHFGRSLLPLIAGQVDQHRDAVFCQGGRRHGETQAMEMESPRGQDFLYWPRMSLQQGEGPEHTKATMCRTDRYKYVHRLYEQDELYDLLEDPGELRNRIHDPALAIVLAQLKQRLMDFYLETADVVPFKADQRG